MLAKRVEGLPAEDDLIFEPKWGGFRAIVFRDAEDILIQSRDERPLKRYFPEIVDALRRQLPSRCVLDGELVIAHEGRLDFNALQWQNGPSSYAGASAGLVAADIDLSAAYPGRAVQVFGADD